jgi:hypothetical protein
MHPEQSNEGQRLLISQSAVWSEVGRTVRLLLALVLATVLLVLLLRGIQWL